MSTKHRHCRCRSSGLCETKRRTRRLAIAHTAQSRVGASAQDVVGRATMVKRRRRKGLKGLTGTSLVPVRRPRPVDYASNDALCPVCYSVPGQPCRKVVSKSGTRPIRFGTTLKSMHGQRSGKPPRGQSPRRRVRDTPRPVGNVTTTPPPRESGKSGHTPFVPKNQRQATRDESGRLRTAGWSRNNADALPGTTRHLSGQHESSGRPRRSRTRDHE